MKRILAMAACAATILGPSLAPADPAPTRTVEGTILLPTTRDSESIYFEPPPGPIARHARCVYLLANETGDGDVSNGLVGWHIDLSEIEGDGLHTYTLTSDTGDIGVYFYDSLGVCEGNAGSTGEGNEPGNEAGTIPWFSNHAIVVVEGAADVSFEFKVFAPEQG